jgi:selenocysteine lyase/cysteine desulfurase
MPGLWGLDASIATLLEFGPDRIESHILSITGELIERLRRIEGVTLYTPPAPDERAGIVTVALAPPLSATRTFERLQAQGLSIAVREGKLRYSPHFYNSMADVRRAAELTEEHLVRQ